MENFIDKWMELFGIKFAPLCIPFRRRLQTLAAGTWFLFLVFGGILGLILTIVLLFTPLRWLVVLYCLWAWTLDRNTCERGGRRSAWVRNWTWWQYVKEYFPLKLERLPFVELDPKKNYLFCAFPHGMMSVGCFNAFGTDTGGFKTCFPHHAPSVVTLPQHFNMPFFREFCFGLGGISCSSTAIKHLLNDPSGGKAVILMVGGAPEAYYCEPGSYKLLLKKRKGFIKIALQTGAPLVPVISFGETDIFSQVKSEDGSKLKMVQEFIRKHAGMAPVIPLGRGFFQYSFGLVPRRTPVSTVVGTPMELPTIENPTNEQINEYHQKFLEALVDMFETQKHHYIKDCENIHLEFEEPDEEKTKTS